MNALQRARWEKTRAKGFWRFVLLWTALFFAAMIISRIVFDIVFYSHLQQSFLNGIIYVALIYLLSGLAGGAALWFYTERRYKASSRDIA